VKTFACIPWDGKGGAIDATSKFFQMALGILKPHESADDKCVYTGIERVQIGMAPDWLLGWMAASFAPKYMLGMVDRYKKAKRDGKL